MLKLKLEIRLGNDAMEGLPGEIIDSLKRSFIAAPSGVFDPLKPGDSGTVLDGYGNTVGEWKVEAE